MNLYLMEAIRASLETGHPSNESEGTIASATQLISPVQQVVLMRRYKPKKDPSKCLKLFTGTAVHEYTSKMLVLTVAKLMEQGHEVISEERLKGTWAGETVGGGIDLQVKHWNSWTVYDLKTTSVFTVMKMSRMEEWTEQLNIYAALMGLVGREVAELRIVTILPDWSQAALKKELRLNPKSNYPTEDSVEIGCELWPKERRDKFIEGRVIELRDALKLPDDKLPRCKDTWGGRRCGQYCDAAPHCHQYKARKDF
jgi:hypothetical protein